MSLLRCRRRLRHTPAVPRRVRARVLPVAWPSQNRRGRRECRVTTSPMARLQQKKQAAVTTGRARHRHSLRDGVTVYIALSPVTFAWLPPSSAEKHVLENLAPASERQDHTTSPSASGHVRLTCPQRPPHPRPTYRDDRPKRPSSSRRDAREHRCDLPDGASADACDRLARRAICAWRACGNCPSGK